MNYYFTRILHAFQRFKWKIKFMFSEKNCPVSPGDISIIVVGRNDNYGGDFSLRLKITMDWNLKQLPGAELIYVEWNRIREKERDCEWIEKRYPAARCYSISNEVHQTITT